MRNGDKLFLKYLPAGVKPETPPAIKRARLTRQREPLGLPFDPAARERLASQIRERLAPLAPDDRGSLSYSRGSFASDSGARSAAGASGNSSSSSMGVSDGFDDAVMFGGGGKGDGFGDGFGARDEKMPPAQAMRPIVRVEALTAFQKQASDGPIVDDTHVATRILAYLICLSGIFCDSHNASNN